MELETFEEASEYLDSLFRNGDEKLVMIAEHSDFLKLNHEIFLELNPQDFNFKWNELKVCIISWVVSEVLGLAMDIYLFNKYSIKLNIYIQGRLRKYHSAELQNTVIEMLNLCLNDNKRFPYNLKLDYLKDYLKGMNSSNLGEGIILDKGAAFDFFRITSLSMEQFAEAFVHTQGFAMSKEEKITELRKEYFELTGRDITSEIPDLWGRIEKELHVFGFFELEKVVILSDMQGLIGLLTKEELPYRIAMLDFLGFTKHLSTKYTTKKECHIKLGGILGTEKEPIAERTIKGNLSTLGEHSTEDRKRYTAHLHKERVKIDYENLK